jgi:multimeric flavodoxin WrbA
MKITTIIGTASKKNTYDACVKLMQNLQQLGDFEYEIIRLSEYKLKSCIGCKTCFDNGEENCPLKDDRDILIRKIVDSDGVVFASPNYSFHVSALMKVFLDRLGYIFHRPQFFGKSFTSIVTEGVYGGNKIVNYFHFIANGLGFNPVKGVSLKTRMPISQKVNAKNELKLEKLSKRFYNSLIKEKFPKPSIIELMMFRMARSGIKRELNEDFKDFKHYKEKGWFESDFFYPVKLNVVQKLAGRLFDQFKMS